MNSSQTFNPNAVIATVFLQFMTTGFGTKIFRRTWTRVDKLYETWELRSIFFASKSLRLFGISIFYFRIVSPYQNTSPIVKRLNPKMNVFTFLSTPFPYFQFCSTLLWSDNHAPRYSNPYQRCLRIPS